MINGQNLRCVGSNVIKFVFMEIYVNFSEIIMRKEIMKRKKNETTKYSGSKR